MSSLPPFDPHSNSNFEELFLINPNNNIIDLTLEELLLQSTAPPNVSHNDFNHNIDSGPVKDRESLGSQQGIDNEGSKLRKISGGVGGGRRKKRIVKCIGGNSKDGEIEGELKKKMDHNEKERIRRMKLNASYLALRALLPTSTDRSKRSKRWSAPAIVDRTLHYIPELEEEVETLRSHKNSLMYSSSTSGEKKTQTNVKRVAGDGDTKEREDDENHVTRRISVESIGEEDAIIQMCYSNKDASNENGLLGLIDAMESLELQEFIIKSSSSICVACNDDDHNNRICCHLHIQIDRGSSSKPNCISIEQVISQLKQQ